MRIFTCSLHSSGCSSFVDQDTDQPSSSTSTVGMNWLQELQSPMNLSKSTQGHQANQTGSPKKREWDQERPRSVLFWTLSSSFPLFYLLYYLISLLYDILIIMKPLIVIPVIVLVHNKQIRGGETRRFQRSTCGQPSQCNTIHLRHSD